MWLVLASITITEQWQIDLVGWVLGVGEDSSSQRKYQLQLGAMVWADNDHSFRQIEAQVQDRTTGRRADSGHWAGYAHHTP